MASSLRVLSGSLTKGSVAVPANVDAQQVSFDHFRQGVNIRSLDDLTSGLQKKARVHAGIVRTLDGRDLDHGYYDDTFSPIRIHTSSAAVMSSPSIAGRLGYRVSHVNENRNLGQTDVWNTDDIFYETVNPEDPVATLDVLDRGKDLPAGLVDHTSVSSMDGKIDMLNIIKSIDRSSIDHPYEAYGVKGSTLHGQDPFLRSYGVEDRYMLINNAEPVEFYLDSVENFGNLVIPGVFNTNTVSIKPFADTSSDVDRYVNKTDSGNDPEMKAVLLGNSFYVDNTLENFDKITIGGFDYDGETDSLSHGGLKK